MTGESISSRPPPLQAPSNLLAPGFRFYPTDEELVVYCMKRKVSGLPIFVDAIAKVDLYKSEPWDLPAKSRFHSRDMEWYFFTPLHRKHSTRARISRTTIKGCWKTTGKDRSVRHGLMVVGMKKTLVFHLGRAPGVVSRPTGLCMSIAWRMRNLPAPGFCRRHLLFVKFYIRVTLDYIMVHGLALPIYKKSGMETMSNLLI